MLARNATHAFKRHSTTDLTLKGETAEAQAARLRESTAAMEQKGFKHPGPRPRFQLLLSETELAKLGSRVRAKMNALVF